VRRRSSWAALITGALVTVVIVSSLPQRIWRWEGLRGRPLEVAGVVVVVVSTIFTLWARFALGTMWSGTVVVREEHRLQTTGPYAVTRHPIYTGLLGMLLGTALSTGTGRWAIVFLVGFVVMEVKLHAEERLLRETFPGDYQRYQARVPQLIPGLRLHTHRHR